MEFFRIHKTIPFMRFSHILNAISFISFAVAVYWIFAHGLAFSIEFRDSRSKRPCRITARRAT